MQHIHIHWLAVVGAVVAKMALGALWYSPVLFLKPWLKASQISREQLKRLMPKALTGDLVGSSLMAFVLAHFVRWAGATTPVEGMVIGLFAWVGFVAVALIGMVTYQGQPVRVIAIINGYLLASLLMMGAILAKWA